MITKEERAYILELLNAPEPTVVLSEALEAKTIAYNNQVEDNRQLRETVHQLRATIRETTARIQLVLEQARNGTGNT